MDFDVGIIDNQTPEPDKVFFLREPGEFEFYISTDTIPKSAKYIKLFYPSNSSTSIFFKYNLLK